MTESSKDLKPEEVIEKIRKIIEEQEKAKGEILSPRIEKTGLICNCGGEIVVEYFYDERFFDRNYLGPQSTPLSKKYYCNNCGLEYEGRVIEKRIAREQKSGT